MHQRISTKDNWHPGHKRGSIFPDETIHPEYSKFLEQIFETNQIAGKSAMELLFSKCSLGEDLIDQIKQTIFSVVGDDEINYQLNSHLLANEYSLTIREAPKYLSLDWNPIIVEECVSKLMVSVKDVTQIRAMEAEAKLRQRELDIISQLLNINDKGYLAFRNSTRNFIQENRQLIKQTPTRNDSALALLFRNMHTIKEVAARTDYMI